MFESSSKPQAKPLVGVVLTGLVAVLLWGVASFAGPCGDGADEMSCVWAARAVLGIGAVAGILALVRIFETNEGERRGLSLGCGLLGCLIACVPGFLIELCADATMRCHTMQVFVICLGVAIGVVGLADLTLRLLALRKR